MNYNDHPGLRWSRLVAGLSSGKRLKYELDYGKPDTAALGLGRVAHMVTLTPDEPIEMVPAEHLTPSGAVSTSAKTRAWIAEAGEYASPADLRVAKAIARAVHTDPTASDWLALCQTREQPVYGELASIGAVKCKPDAYDSVTGTLVDLKTHSSRSGSITTNSVLRAVVRYYYAGQMAFYRRVLRAAGLPIGDVVLIFVESSAPYDVIVVRLGEDWMAYGDALVDEALAVWSCVSKGIIEGAAPGLVDLPMPNWLVDSADDDDVSDLELEGV